MIRFFVWLALAFSAAVTPAAESKRWAFIIGINNYSIFNDLNYCSKDAVALADALRRCGFDDERIFLIHDGAEDVRHLPFKANIELQLDNFLAAVGPDDLIVVSFDGHGIHVDDQSYLCPVEAHEDRPKETMIAVDTVYQKLNGCKAALKLLIVDACRDDPRPPGKKGVAAIRDTSSLAATFERPPEGLIVLSSCSPGQASWENRALKYSVFTHFLLEGLEGGADRDRDRRVTLLELYEYVSTETKLYAAKVLSQQQFPMLKGEIRGVFEITGQPAAPKITPPNVKLEPFVLAACEAGEVTSESDKLKSGVFSYCVRKALEGKADTDKNRQVTSNELFHFVQLEMPRHLTGTEAGSPLVAAGQVPELIRGKLSTAFAITPTDGKGWAVLVGVDEYESGIGDLAFAASDSESIADLLVQSGFPPEQVIRLNDQVSKAAPTSTPNRQNVVAGLEQLAKKATDDDIVVFFFIGQGLQQGNEILFCMRDSKLDRPDSFLKLSDVYAQLRSCKARRQVVLFDSCRNNPQSPSVRSR